MNKRYVPVFARSPVRSSQQDIGMYAKLGGGFTAELIEAEIVGWTKTSHDKWFRRGYELKEVTIQLT